MNRTLPPVTRILLLANFVILLLDSLLERYHIRLYELFGLWSPTFSVFNGAGSFHFWQPLTYMFLHSGFGHFFANMFAVWMFGPSLEQHWGSGKFTAYYLVCGIGAALVQIAVWSIFMPSVPAVTIGASGAVFGILFAFGWLFPDVPMFILFIPIPIRARTFVLFYAAFELFAGLANVAGDNVAHFAHLGGMLFGWLLILAWQKGWFNRPPRFLNSRKGKSDGNADRFRDYHYHKSV